MPRSWTIILSWVGGLLLCVGQAWAEEGRLCETLLPDTTQGFAAISNVDKLSEHWEKTQLGHLMADPVMAPFKKDIHRQFESRWSSVHDRLGLTLDDMKDVPGGDVGIGLIAPKPGKSALAIVIDVTGKLPEANEMLKKVAATQLQRGAKQSEVKVEGCPDAVVQFDLPEPTEEQEAKRSTLEGSPKTEADKKNEAAKPETAPAVRQAFYCLTGTLLAVTDNLDVMKGILGRAAGNQNGSLADHKPFQAVMQRCQSDAPEGLPQIRWYIHPIGYAEAARAATPEGQRRKGKSILEVMRNQGVSAIQGVGGFVDFSAEDYELVHRTSVYAPQSKEKPYEKAMRMLVLPNKDDFTPQPWVPRDIATYTTLYFDILNAFDNFDSLFEELFGQGDKGVWKDVLESLEKDPNGPQVNLRKDLIEHLGQRISVLTDYQLPITTTSERLLFAIEAKDAKAVAAAIEKLMKNDPTVKERKVEGHVIWEMVQDESPEPQAPEISFGDMPAVGPEPAKKKKSEEDEDAEPKLLPHAAVTVWEDHLIIASHIDFLLKVITPPRKPELLVNDVDYKLVIDECDKLATKEKCVRLFSRTDEAYRPTYELVRQNKMPESETMLGRLLNALFGEGKKGEVRHQQIDGSQLPEYDVVRRYLGPAGLQTTSEPDGWFFKGFTLSKGGGVAENQPEGEPPAEQ